MFTNIRHFIAILIRRALVAVLTLLILLWAPPNNVTPGLAGTIADTGQPRLSQVSPSKKQIINADSGVIFFGQRINGTIENGSDADVFHFDVVEGEAVRVELKATSGDLDPTLTLVIDGCNEVEECFSEAIHDDNSGEGNGALIALKQSRVTGQGIILIDSADGSSSGDYQLSLIAIDKDSNLAAIDTNVDAGGGVGGSVTSAVRVYNTLTRGLLFDAGGSAARFAGYSPDGDFAAIDTDADAGSRVYNTRT
ncbi:MAG: hypothetical protein R3264_02905, partial [Anaerolineae bacterium]|nr:hypothetical protein [Anaerolineae bacterium]